MQIFKKSIDKKPKICDYANLIYPNYNPCNCIDRDITGHDGGSFISPQNIDEYLQRFSPIQLRDTAKTIDLKMSCINSDHSVTFSKDFLSL